VALALRRFDDWGSIMVGDVVESKRNVMARQDVPDRNAEGGPRKLDEGEHGGLYDRSEVKPQDRKKVSLAALLAHPPVIRISHRMVGDFLPD
jgi:hypothetical protein